MSGGLTSLESAIRTCKVNTGNADRIQSDRFLGFPDEKTCPSFLGTDLAGRSVCPDSFMTKSAGCNAPEDRIYIENAVSRPYYYEYIPKTIEGFGFGQQGAAFIRERYGGRPYGQAEEQALWDRAEMMGQNPVAPNTSHRYEYRMMGDY